MINATQESKRKGLQNLVESYSSFDEHDIFIKNKLDDIDEIY